MLSNELILPLTGAQSGIWRGQQLSPDSPCYWTGEVLCFQGEVQLDLFQQAVDHVLRHAQSLHMTVLDDHTASYPVAPPEEGSCRPCLSSAGLEDFGALDSEALSTLLNARAPSTPPALGQPMWQQVLAQTGPTAFAWALWAHHLTLDGYGFALVHAAVAESYANLCSGRPLADLSHWQIAGVVEEDQAYSRSAQRERASHYWLSKLQSLAASTVATWPSTKPLPASSTTRRSKAVIQPDQMDAWRHAASQQGVDWLIWLAAGAARTVASLMAQPRVLLGWPVMNRLGSRALTVPCMHMNIVPLVLQSVPGATNAQLTQQVSAALREMRPHQRYRYEHLRQERRRRSEHGRIFGPVLNIMPFDRALTMPGLSVVVHTLSSGPVEDLSINLSWNDTDALAPLRISVEGNPFLYDQAALDKLTQTLRMTWQTAAMGQEAKSEPKRVLTGQPLAGAPPQLLQGSAILGQLSRFAQEHGGRVAVRCPGQVLTYQALWHDAMAHACAMSSHLPQSGGKVLIALPRHAQTLALILGVWLAGACYIPLDPATPTARRQLILEDASPHVVITTSELADALNGSWHLWTPDLIAAREPAETSAGISPEAILGQLRTAEDAAYVIYTSGSTGRPNGVMISHGGLNHFLVAASETYHMRRSDRMLQFAPLHFDASVEELFLPLMNGASIVMRDDRVLESPTQLLHYLCRHDITVLDLPTAYWHELMSSLAQDTALRAQWPDSIRLVIIGGEAAQQHHVNQWRSHMPPEVVLLNTYGPTETTVICSAAILAGPGAVDIGEGIPIGLPLPGLRFILSEHHLAGVDTSSATSSWHLSVEGPTLALGYLGNARLTHERFQCATETDPPGLETRHYRTGDLVSLNSSGQLIYQGRVDDELKISGHRIAPSEIESALLTHPGVVSAVILAHGNTSESKQLVAFVVPRASVGTEDTVGDGTIWREHLRQRLPAPAVPSRFIIVNSLPLNQNNKVDRHALKASIQQKVDSQTAAHSALITSELEALIARTWSPLLGQHGIEPQSDFFAMGGASLQAIQACSRLAVLLEREVPVSMLFAHPTLASFAKALSEPVAHHPPTLGSGQELQPLLRIQRGTSMSSPVLMCIHPAEGLSWCYFGLGRHLPGVEIWGLQSPGITGAQCDTFEALIERYASLVRQVRPHGPYAFLGWSSGGGIAHAVAAYLQAQGEEISLLAMMDSFPASIWLGKPDAREQDALEALLDVIGASALHPDGSAMNADEMRQLLRRPGSPLALLDEPTHQRLIDNALHGMHLYRCARHTAVDGSLLYFRAAIRGPSAPDDHGWTPHIQGAIRVIDIESDHNGMSQPKPLAAIGKVLAEHIIGTPPNEPKREDLKHATV
jgi:amino acid adenylation domain-containing protein